MELSEQPLSPPGLISFQKGDSLTPPPFDIFFCFGEDWPDYKPKEKKLIIVQVRPSCVQMFSSGPRHVCPQVTWVFVLRWFLWWLVS